MIIQTVDAKTGKIQFWSISNSNPRHFYCKDVINTYSHANLRDVSKAIDDLKDLRKTDLVMTPLVITEASQAYESRLQHRGYTNDPNPFIIRNKPLGELKAQIFSDNTVHFGPQFSSDGCFTPTQQNELRNRFPELINIFNDPQTLDNIRKIEKARILECLKKDINMIRMQLDEVENFNP